MVASRSARCHSGLHFLSLAAILLSGSGCVGPGDGSGPGVVRAVMWGPRGGGSHNPDEEIRLPAAEQMIDELDRIMTANGTIGVKSPDVWGQDRLAKFRSEYETQMATWLKAGFKGELNASIRREESEARRLQLGTSVGESTGSASSPSSEVGSAAAVSSALASSETTTRATGDSADKTAVALEPTVVLDEHSNYLNHLNQLRRINAGDDLADRPGYGLYLVRIPVTLSPGPKSRRGKGAIITVSARSLMTQGHAAEHAAERGHQRDREQSDTVDLQPVVQAERPLVEPGRRLVLAGRLCRQRDPVRATEHQPAERRGRAPA